MLDRGRVRAVLFDVDGTLRDTDDEVIAGVMRRMPERLPVTGLERALRAVVIHGETPMQHLLSLADRFDLDGPINRLVARVAVGGHGATRLTPHAGDVIRRLSVRYRLGIVSAGPAAAVTRVLEDHGLTDLIEVVVSGLSYRRTKPHPEPVLGALATLGVPPEAGVMVGDIPIDIRAGRAAGSQTVAALTGFATRRELVRERPDLLIDDLSELAAALGV